MADLQVDLDTTTEAGDLDRPAAPTPETPPISDVFEPAPARETATAPGSRSESAAEELLPRPEPSVPDPLRRARALLAAHPVADGYSGLPWALRGLPWYDLELGDNAVDADVPRLRSGGVGAQFWSVHVPDSVTGDRVLGATLEQLDRAKHAVRSHSEGLRLAASASEVADARHCGRIATLLGPARAEAIGDSLAALRALHALGLCSLTLSGTSWAGPEGPSPFGEEVVRELNRLGVLAELSGASDATARRVLAVSRAPVLFARSGARALRDTPANLPDDLLTALGAAKGLCLVPLAAGQTGSSIREVADHLDHVRRLAGPESVGLSGMYDTPDAHPDGLGDVSHYPYLIAELIERGWPDADLARLTWGNVQRVLRGADFAARAARERRRQQAAL
ncbi:membrane dipeptidase [Streptomyces sp. NPDC046853]|uniref:membrane dipeptidase n=1 Tax=Streptomyces sp. NPDC046853 TaxID=3154920 RepID=UPI0033E0555D